MINLVNGSFNYSNSESVRQVLTNINIKVSEGEFISIIGKSGCGKTTLLKIFAGLLKISSGQLSVEASQLNKNTTGWVPQFPVLMPNKTILQNIILPLECTNKKINNDLISQHIKKYGLDKYIDLYPYQISGGTKQKASIVRALITNPQLLLMDEPFSSIDAYTRELINLDLAQKLRSEKITTILVTHSLDEAVFLSDRIFIMSANTPSTIIKEVKINFAGDRNSSLKNTPDYLKKLKEVRLFLYENII